MKKRILICEDEDVLSRLFEREFVHNDFEVDCAHDGLEAVRKALFEKYDFILIDIMMPNLDGISVYKKLLESPSYSNAPVGFLSALGKDISRFVGDDEAIIAKAKFYFSKDLVTPQQIVDAVINSLYTDKIK